MAPKFRTQLESDRIVLFDGLCNLCAGWSRFLLRFDRAARFRLATVQSPEGESILRAVGLPTDDYETMVLVQDGRLFTKSDAVLEVMRQLPAPWPALCAGRVLPRALRDGLYDRLARNRYRLFGRREQCMAPPSNAAARFLGH